METEIAGHPCFERGQEAVRKTPAKVKHLAVHKRSPVTFRPSPRPSTRVLCQETTMCQPRGSGALLSILHLLINPLCQELRTEFSALTQKAPKCISFHRQEQNGMVSVDCSGSSLAFCPGLTIVGLIKEHVSSRGFSNIYRMYLVSPANNSPIGPQIECKRLRHSCSGCYFAALLHNEELKGSSVLVKE